MTVAAYDVSAVAQVVAEGGGAALRTLRLSSDLPEVVAEREDKIQSLSSELDQTRLVVAAAKHVDMAFDTYYKGHINLKQLVTALNQARVPQLSFEGARTMLTAIRETHERDLSLDDVVSRAPNRGGCQQSPTLTSDPESWPLPQRTLFAPQAKQTLEYKDYSGPGWDLQAGARRLHDQVMVFNEATHLVHANQLVAEWKYDRARDLLLDHDDLVSHGQKPTL